MVNANATTPFPRSYWVVPGMLLAGEYPGAGRPGEAQERLSRLIDGGIRTIINLMEPDEIDHSGNPFQVYDSIVARISKEKELIVDCKRFTIADGGVPTESQMRTMLRTIANRIEDKKPVYVHCRGGIGRTGTVVGCYLLEHGMARPDTVLNTIADLRQNDPMWHLISPETDGQRDFVAGWRPTGKGAPTRLSRFTGCMIGGAVGDALGAPVEFMNLDEIGNRYGPAGVTGLEKAYGRKGAVTDDTRMSLFTAEGLILSRVRKEYAGKSLVTPAVYHAYLRWLYTQDTGHQDHLIKMHGTCAVIDGILTGHKEMFSRRAPGNACLCSLRSGRMGTMDQPVNDSKGCGGVMRAAPVGLACPDAENAFLLGCESAAITHGHPTGYLSAGFLAALISRLSAGEPLMTAVSDAIRILVEYKNHKETLRAVEAAIALSRKQHPSPGIIETLGAGWVADQALAIGLYCSLAAGKDFRRGVLSAVNHSGDSDSTGSIAGNIIGAQYGFEIIPGEWMADLEMKDVIQEVAADLHDQFLMDPQGPCHRR